MAAKKTENHYRWMFREILVPFLATGVGVWLAFYANRIHDEKTKEEKRSRLIEAMLVEIMDIKDYLKNYEKFAMGHGTKVAVPFGSDILESTLTEQVELFNDSDLIHHLDNFKTLVLFLKKDISIVYDYEWKVTEPTAHGKEIAKLAALRIEAYSGLFTKWEKETVKMLAGEYRGKLPGNLDQWVSGELSNPSGLP